MCVCFKFAARHSSAFGRCLNAVFPPAVLQRKAAEVRGNRNQLKHIEDLSAAMEERLILDNK